MKTKQKTTTIILIILAILTATILTLTYLTQTNTHKIQPPQIKTPTQTNTTQTLKPNSPTTNPNPQQYPQDKTLTQNPTQIQWFENQLQDIQNTSKQIKTTGTPDIENTCTTRLAATDEKCLQFINILALPLQIENTTQIQQEENGWTLYETTLTDQNQNPIIKIRIHANEKYDTLQPSSTTIINQNILTQIYQQTAQTWIQ